MDGLRNIAVRTKGRHDHEVRISCRFQAQIDVQRQSGFHPHIARLRRADPEIKRRDPRSAVRPVDAEDLECSPELKE